MNNMLLIPLYVKMIIPLYIKMIIPLHVTMIIPLYITLYTISGICLWILLSAILLNFYFSKKGFTRKEKKSVVETGSMLGFFILMVLLIYLKIGAAGLNPFFQGVSAVVGTVFIVTGTGVNIAGRLKLKMNWSNQIRIYENQSLVTTGIYRYIRHPLYSSTVLMMTGFALLFHNYLVLILTLAVFLPFMIFRAGQEDVLLAAEFKDEYVKYKEKTGLFFPKFRK